MLTKSGSVLLVTSGRCLLQSRQVVTLTRCVSWNCSRLAQGDIDKQVYVRYCHTGTNVEEAKLLENLRKVREGRFKEAQMTHPEELKHFRNVKPDLLNQEAAPPEKPLPMGSTALPHPIWTDDEVQSVKITHKEPEKIVDKMAFRSVKLLRWGYDTMSGFGRKERTEAMWLTRLAFLETVAGVPGMVAAMVRHLHSLRRMRRDHGWIHTLLEEAENERMHLMTVLQLKQPSLFFRTCVMFTQGVFVTGFSAAYMLSPRFCHRFVAYLEEEAVITYSKLLKDMDGGSMQHWNATPAPEVAISYWNLHPDAKMKDVVLAIRADEAHHRVVNHTLSSMKQEDYNPYGPGK